MLSGTRFSGDTCTYCREFVFVVGNGGLRIARALMVKLIKVHMLKFVYLWSAQQVPEPEVWGLDWGGQFSSALVWSLKESTLNFSRFWPILLGTKNLN